MKLMWKAVCAVMFLTAATTIEIGCGDTYRPIAAPAPVITGNPSGTEMEAVLNQCPSGSVCVASTGATTGSTLTSIDVSGDSNAANKPLANQVGTVTGPVAGSLASPMEFDYSRTSVYTANTSTDSVTQILLSPSTAGFAANTTTISLPAGSQPIGMSFQYYGGNYTQDFVVNSGTKTANCPGTGSLGVLVQASDEVTANVCVGKTPVYAWIYHDQTKVFVLDKTENRIYVVSASQYRVTNTIPVGVSPFKVAQSNNGNYVYVLNGGGSISVVDGQAETVVDTVPTALAGTSALPIDIAQDSNYNDTTANTQINHVWVLHADGTVSVWDGTTPGTLKWITSIATITPAQLSAGVYPTNVALMRDGSWAYVGLGNTDKIAGINTSQLAVGAVTQNATTTIPVGVHNGTVQSPVTASLSYTYTDTTTGKVLGPFTGTVPVQVTTPTVTSVAVSRGGNSADLAKVYATTTTSTTYYCYDYQVKATDCSDPNGDPWANGNTVTASGTTSTPPPSPFPFLATGCTSVAGQNAMTCPNLYNGTAVVTAASIGATPVNTYVTTIPAPAVVTYCDPGNPETGEFDGQKNCPAMIPAMLLGRS